MRLHLFGSKEPETYIAVANDCYGRCAMRSEVDVEVAGSLTENLEFELNFLIRFCCRKPGNDECTGVRVLFSKNFINKSCESLCKHKKADNIREQRH